MITVVKRWGDDNGFKISLGSYVGTLGGGLNVEEEGNEGRKDTLPSIFPAWVSGEKQVPLTEPKNPREGGEGLGKSWFGARSM